jgi:hypothetical protein
VKRASPFHTQAGEFPPPVQPESAPGEDIARSRRHSSGVQVIGYALKLSADETFPAVADNLAIEIPHQRTVRNDKM